MASSRLTFSANFLIEELASDGSFVPAISRNFVACSSYALGTNPPADPHGAQPLAPEDVTSEAVSKNIEKMREKGYGAATVNQRTPELQAVHENQEAVIRAFHVSRK